MKLPIGFLVTKSKRCYTGLVKHFLVEPPERGLPAASQMETAAWLRLQLTVQISAWERGVLQSMTRTSAACCAPTGTFHQQRELKPGFCPMTSVPAPSGVSETVLASQV